MWPRLTHFHAVSILHESIAGVVELVDTRNMKSNSDDSEGN